MIPYYYVNAIFMVIGFILILYGFVYWPSMVVGIILFGCGAGIDMSKLAHKPKSGPLPYNTPTNTYSNDDPSTYSNEGHSER